MVGKVEWSTGKLPGKASPHMQQEDTRDNGEETAECSDKICWVIARSSSCTVPGCLCCLRDRLSCGWMDSVETHAEDESTKTVPNVDKDKLDSPGFVVLLPLGTRNGAIKGDAWSHVAVQQ